MDATPKPVRLRFSVFELDVSARELRKNGRRVNLQQQPFQALVALLEQPGKVVSREEEALLCLDQAVAKRATGTIYLAVEPQFDPLRSDPRFHVLLRTIGLPSK